MVTRLDRPVVAVERQEVLGIGAVGGMVGDAVGEFPGLFAGFLHDHMALDDVGQADAGEVEILVESSRGPDRTRLDAAMGQFGFFAEIGLAPAGKGDGELIEQRGLIAFDRKQVMRITVEDFAGKLALGQKCVGGQRLAGEIDFEGIDQRGKGADFVGLLGLVVAGAG